MKTINIAIPCFNEEQNIPLLYERIKKEVLNNDKYNFELIFIDNSSVDNTVEVLRCLAIQDRSVKVIINNRNFGPIRSGYWAILQSRGSALICMSADLQDPPELISQFIENWEKGWMVVLGVKPKSQTNFIMHFFRRKLYKLFNSVANINLVPNATGFGIYDKKVVDAIKEIRDPYPFFRGIISELGYPIKTIEFVQPRRINGKSNQSIYSLYDMAMLGMVSHSVLPIRMAGIVGLLISIICFAVAITYLILKLIFWDRFPIGTAPLILGNFFMFGMLFTLIGITGEYIGSIHNYVRGWPIVTEKERINFDEDN